MSESRSNYKKTDVKLELINELRARSMTLGDIKNFLSSEYRRLGKARPRSINYKVCDRTVKRTIDSIRDLYGDQLDFNREFGLYKLDLHDFPDTMDTTEIQALDVAIQKMGNNLNSRKLLENLKAKLTTRLYRKIEYTEPKKAARKINDIDQKINANYAFIGPHPIIDFDIKVKSALDSAISNQHIVHFRYKHYEPSVCPLGIMYGPSNVYLIAYVCKGTKISDIPQHYILSEISNLTETEDWFPKDPKFSIVEYANSMFGIYNDGVVYDIEWIVKDPGTIKLVKKYQFHPTQEFIDNTDGTLTIKMRTGGLRAVSIYLTQWGGKIIPVAPKELLNEYRKLLKTCVVSIKNSI